MPDPRGSGSRTIAAPMLAELGELHYGRKKVQPRSSVIREFYEKADARLLHPVIRFNSQQIDSMALAFGEALKKFRYTCYAAAIMPDHVHLVIRKHRHIAEEMIGHLQEYTRLRFSTLLSLSADHPIWTLGGWKRYLNTPADLRRVTSYVEQNAAAAGLAPQQWPFVTAYNNWPFHKCRA